MAKQYTVRSAEGTMVAKLGIQVVNRLMLEVKGHWGTDRSGANRFYIEEDCTFGLGNDDSVMRIYFWKGYSITKD